MSRHHHYDKWPSKGIAVKDFSKQKHDDLTTAFSTLKKQSPAASSSTADFQKRSFSYRPPFKFSEADFPPLSSAVVKTAVKSKEPEVQRPRAFHGPTQRNSHIVANENEGFWQRDVWGKDVPMTEDVDGYVMIDRPVRYRRLEDYELEDEQSLWEIL